MPNYIKLAHWLYEENRMVALTEAAEFMNVTVNGIHHYIKAILKYDDIFKVKICQVDDATRKQYAIRVLAIRPYKLIPGRRPISEDNIWHGFQESCYSMADIWRELISKPWCKMYISI
ncbi:hypothetical protein ACK30T_07885 [Aeromonas caviae]|uniref:hypothetical protein n=1 Tax=Aeromonas caviae TaxID=648 RepID=UPI002B47561D|nr:hypothetical protein [Aeromonas caviae]